jgi:hypothetical protein
MGSFGSPQQTDLLSTILIHLNEFDGFSKASKSSEERSKRVQKDSRKSIGCDRAALIERFDTPFYLACMYSSTARLQEAEKMYFQALEESLRALGPHHQLTRLTLCFLECLYIKSNNTKMAWVMFRRAVNGMGKKQGTFLGSPRIL